MSSAVEDLGAQIEKRWIQLGEPAEDGSLKVVDLPQTVAAGPLLLGTSADGSRLLVPLAADVHRALRQEKRSNGVHLLLRQLEASDGNRWYLDVVCVRGDLRWLFSSFVADILLRFERQPDIDPPTIVRTCCFAWRAMFAGAGPRLTLRQLAAVYGELCILERLLQRSSSALERWRGPFQEPHDFVGPGVDIEVKTTLSDDDERVHIHGIEQLANVDGVELFLAHLRVQAPSDEGETMEEMVSRLEGLEPSGRLNGMLSSVGYDDAARQTYAEMTLHVIAERWHAVGETFPRLTPKTFPGAEVPDGLNEFSYRLDLASVTDLPIPTATVEALLDRTVT